MVWRALETAVREPVAVYATTSSGGMYNVRVAIRQRVPGEARNAIAACFGSLANVKNVFVVDPDIDIFSDEQMDWALATRFQPDRDLIVVDGACARMPLDPSLMPATAHRRQGRLRPDLADRHGGRSSNAQCRRRRTTRARASPRSRRRSPTGRNIFEELMTRGRQPRRPRGRAARSKPLRAAGTLDRDAEGRYVVKECSMQGAIGACPLQRSILRREGRVNTISYVGDT